MIHLLLFSILIFKEIGINVIGVVWRGLPSFPSPHRTTLPCDLRRTPKFPKTPFNPSMLVPPASRLFKSVVEAFMALSASGMAIHWSQIRPFGEKWGGNCLRAGIQVIDVIFGWCLSRIQASDWAAVGTELDVVNTRLFWRFDCFASLAWLMV